MRITERLIKSAGELIPTITMHPKVMILVSRTHWRCISCRLVSQHVVSIDEHIKICHINLLSPATTSSPAPPSECDQGSYSDGELYSASNTGVLMKTKKTFTDDLPTNFEQDEEASISPGEISGKRRRTSKIGEARNTQRKTLRKASPARYFADVSDSGPSSELSDFKDKTRAGTLPRSTTRGKQSKRGQSNFDARSNTDGVSSNTKQGKGGPRKKRKLPSVSSAEEDKADYEHPRQKEQRGRKAKPTKNEADTEGENLHNHAKISRKVKQSSNEGTGDETLHKHTKRGPKGGRPGYVKKRTKATKSQLRSAIYDGEVKKPGLGGKPVKRTFEVTETEKKELKECYVGIQKSVKTEVNQRDVEKAALSSQNADDHNHSKPVPQENPKVIVSDHASTGAQVCTDLQGTGHSSTNKISSELQTTYSTNDNRTDPLTLTENRPKLLYTNENKTELLTPNESRTELLTSNKNKTEVLGENRRDVLATNELLTASDHRPELLVAGNENRFDVWGMNESRPGTSGNSISEANGALTRSNMMGTYVTLTGTHPQSENIQHQPSAYFPPPGVSVSFPSPSQDFLPHAVSVSHYRGYGYPTSVPAVPQISAGAQQESVPNTDANLYAYRPNRTVANFSACAINEPTELLPSFGAANTPHYSTGQCLSDSLQAENYGQVAVPKATKVTEMSANENLETQEPEEWVKNKTRFSFTNPKPSLTVEQPSQIFECTVCQAKFSSTENLSCHVSKMDAHSDGVSQCKSCLRNFHSSHDLNLHVFGEHEKKKKPFCFECGEKFHSMETFEKHLHQHLWNQDPVLLDMEFHACQICKADVVCKYAIIQKHYYNKHKVTTCLECFVRSELVVLSDSVSVKEHRQMHINFCNICIRDFQSAESLQAHYQYHTNSRQEEDGKGHLCEKCRQWCPNKASVVLHHKEHKLQIMRDWRVEKWGIGITCVHCDKVLRNKRNLQRHIAQLHSSTRSYKFHCEFCGKGVDSKSNLKDHIALRHLGIKRYICEFCHQRFACAPTLRRHVLRDHATDKQYTCEFCGERFCEKFNLTKHMYIHTGSARFMCEQCGKAFHSSSEFKKHTSVHAEKREFVCQGCGQGYKRKEHLKRHLTKCTKVVQTEVQMHTDGFDPV